MQGRTDLTLSGAILVLRQAKFCCASSWLGHLSARLAVPSHSFAESFSGTQCLALNKPIKMLRVFKIKTNTQVRWLESGIIRTRMRWNSRCGMWYAMLITTRMRQDKQVPQSSKKASKILPPSPPPPLPLESPPGAPPELPSWLPDSAHGLASSALLLSLPEARRMAS